MKCSKCGFESDISIATITDKNGSVQYCLNCTSIALINRQLHMENDETLVDDITGENGAVKFECGDETYILDSDTMKRLIALDLDPDEYFALAKKYGADKFHIHSDFYDDCDGVAIQPLRVY